MSLTFLCDDFGGPKTDRADEVARLATSLARDGLIKNEPWLESAASQVSDRFACFLQYEIAESQIHHAAVILALSHPLAAQYLAQAPVIACRLLNGREAALTNVRYELVEAARKYFGPRPKLRDLLKQLGLAYQLRALHESSLGYPYAFVGMLRKISVLIDPSSLSQRIPSEAVAQQQWLHNLFRWNSHLVSRLGSGLASERHLRWAVHNLPIGVCEITSLADYACTLDQINPRWSYLRFEEESTRWHQAMARQRNMPTDLAFRERFGVGLTDRMPALGMPAQLTVREFEFVAILSGLDLIEEGIAMQHCVADYAHHLISGQSRFYSVRSAGKRAATLQVMGEMRAAPGQIAGVRTTWFPYQCTGRRNARINDEIGRAVIDFIGFANLPADQQCLLLRTTTDTTATAHLRRETA